MKSATATHAPAPPPIVAAVVSAPLLAGVTAAILKSELATNGAVTVETKAEDGRPIAAAMMLATPSAMAIKVAGDKRVVVTFRKSDSVGVNPTLAVTPINKPDDEAESERWSCRSWRKPECCDSAQDSPVRRSVMLLIATVPLEVGSTIAARRLAAREARKPGCAASSNGAIAELEADSVIEIEILNRTSTSNKHVVEPISGASLPKAHGAQAADVLAPGMRKAVLIGQRRHTDWPALAVKLPAAQEKHCAVASDSAETTPYEPAAHDVPAHTAEPGVAVQVPGTQGMHVLAFADEELSGPALPAAQGAPAQAVVPTDGA